jgi:hypothetical protein
MEADYSFVALNWFYSLDRPLMDRFYIVNTPSTHHGIRTVDWIQEIDAILFLQVLQ